MKSDLLIFSWAGQAGLPYLTRFGRLCYTQGIRPTGSRRGEPGGWVYSEVGIGTDRTSRTGGIGGVARINLVGC